MIREKRICCLLLALLVLLAGCGQRSARPAGDTQEPPVQYYLDYYYCIKEDGYVSETSRQMLSSFGERGYFAPAASAVQTHTQIPEVTNGAKGHGYISLVLPEADPAQYRSSAKEPADADSLEMVACYRTVGGMTTDELVNIYMDPSENIVKFETVNYGKYDDPALDDAAFENVRTTFSHAINKVSGISGGARHAPEDGQTSYHIFTDAQGNVVVATDVFMEQDGKLLEVELYALVRCTKPLLPAQEKSDSLG